MISDQRILPEIPVPSRRNTGLPESNCQREETCEAECESLGAIVTACQAGDLGAQRQLYVACHEKVYRLAMRMVGMQEAADVTQQVFLQVFRSLDQFHGRSRFDTWLYRLAVNESLQYLRRNRRWQHHELDWEPMDGTQQGNEDAQRKELLELALARIDPELRSIFLLREVEELSYHEIAKALQIPEGTVGSRLNRARRELRRILSDLEPDV